MSGLRKVRETEGKERGTGGSFQDGDQRNGTTDREVYGGGQGKYLFFNIDDITAYLYTDRKK